MRKALQAVLIAPTRKAAAQAAGISEDTLRKYFADPEFLAEYTRLSADMLSEATAQATNAFSPAILRLRAIVEDKKQPPQAQIQAARSLLEYGLRLNETVEIERRLRALEERSKDTQ